MKWQESVNVKKRPISEVTNIEKLIINRESWTVFSNNGGAVCQVIELRQVASV